MKQPISRAIHNLYQKGLQHTKYRWFIILGTLLYFVSPLDISPDVLPFIGWLDDGIIASLLISEVSQLIMQKIGQKKQSDVQSVSYTEVLDTDDEIPTITVEAVQVG